MNAARLILTARFRADRNHHRQASGRIALTFTLATVAATGTATAYWMGERVRGWRADGSTALWEHLWPLALIVCGGLVVFAALATLREGFGADEAVLLMLMPLSPASRFRSVFVAVLISAVRPEVLTFLAVLSLLLGRDAPGWLLVGATGSVMAVLAGVTATLLAARGLGGTQRPRTRAVLLGGLVAAVLVWAGFRVVGAKFISPVPTAVLLALLTLLAVGPGASWLGRLYVDAFQQLDGRSGGARITRAPAWARPFVGRLTQRRDVVGAMLVKELLYQGRNPINLLRLVILLAAVPVFPLLRSSLDRASFSDVFLVVAFASGLGLYGLVDFVPSPIGSEGNRLTIYLTAPVESSSVLLAKFVVFVAPSLLLNAVLVLVLGGWLRLTPSQLLFALGSTWLIQVATTAALVWGSAWDEDLDVPVEGLTQTMLHEHAPITSRRIWLINTSIIVLTVGLIAFWRLPVPLVVPSLVALDAAVLAVAWRLGMRWLRRLSDAG